MTTLTLNDIQNLNPIGLNLDQLSQLEMEAELVEIQHYAPLGEIEESENVTKEQLEFVEKETSYLNAIFGKFRTTFEHAVELATIQEGMLY